MKIACALLCGFVLDLIFGDPEKILHPVVIIGKAITALEKVLRRILPKTTTGETAGGAILTACIVAGTFGITLGICIIATMIHPALGFAVQTLWCWQALSIKGLKDASVNVYRCLSDNSVCKGQQDRLEAGRNAVGRIVGRDTAGLSEEGVIKAAVETVAENFADGVIAPMLYFAVGGAPLGMTFKAINTMDSMVGYKNDRYLYFGRAAARLDDVAGYIPARLAAMFLIIAAAFLKDRNNKKYETDSKDVHMIHSVSVAGAWKIWRRDRRNHASPNSAQTEAACAGALGVQLAGPAYYFGKRYDKPYIGDSLRAIDLDDILTANRLMYAAGSFAAAALILIRAALIL